MDGEREGAAEGVRRGLGPKLRERLHTIAFMMVLGAVCAAGIGAAKLALARRIDLNEGLFRQRKVLEALRLIPHDGRGEKPTAEKVRAIYDARVREVRGQDNRPAYYLALSSDGGKAESVGVVSSWQGFWGRIDAVMTVTPSDRRLWGFSVFSHSETPGLGARMTEPEFRAQFFSGRMVVPGTDKRAGLQVDAITGATRTSESMLQFVNGALPKLVDQAPTLGPEAVRGAR